MGVVNFGPSILQDKDNNFIESIQTGSSYALGVVVMSTGGVPITSFGSTTVSISSGTFTPSSAVTVTPSSAFTVALSSVATVTPSSVATVTPSSAVTVTLSSAATVTASSAVTVGNTYTLFSFTPVVSTAAYASSDVVGTLNALSGIPLNGFIQSVTLTCKSNQNTQIDVMFFTSSMANTTFTDNGVIAVSTQNSTSIGPVVHIMDWTSGGTPSLGQANGLGYSFAAGVSTAYCALISRGTPTLSSTNDLLVNVTFVS